MMMLMMVMMSSFPKVGSSLFASKKHFKKQEAETRDRKGNGASHLRLSLPPEVHCPSWWKETVFPSVLVSGLPHPPVQPPLPPLEPRAVNSAVGSSSVVSTGLWFLG